jgi:hypothetical protein
MLSKTVKKRTAQVYWGEENEVVATVRALDPKDLADILVEMGQDIGGVFKALDEVDDLRTAVARAGGDPNVVADKIMQSLPQALVAFRQHLPDIMAKIVATAADQPDDWEYVRDNYDAMLQFLILGEICRVTFVTVDGFKVFVGNAAALVTTIGKITSAKDPKAIRPGSSPSSAGSAQS